MKKNEKRWKNPFGIYSRKVLFIMKLIVFIICFTTLGVYASTSYSQGTKLTLDMHNTAIKKVLLEIENNSEFYFLYNNELIDVEKEIDIDVKNQKITEILDVLFDGQEVNFDIRDRQIVISPKNKLNRSLQNQNQVSGKVSDESGQAVPGVTVIIKGTSQGIVTGIDGTYALANLPEEAVLVFSFVGMKTQEIEVGNQSVIDVVLKVDAIGLDEVVAVGYGVQRKVNLTGSVATVNSQDLIKRPVTNAQNMLQGKVAGLQVTQNSGQPGDDGSVMRVRGIGTLSGAGNNPLVLIDGVQGSLSNLDPNNVESISVLKDAASAAIYGARAANGVILVTTKKGKSGALSIDYIGNFQIHQATRMPDLVTNSADYMEMWNYANERAGLPKYFEQSEIDAFRNSNDPVKYPNYNWMDEMIGNAFAQNHYFSANGGVGGTTYNFSLNLQQKSGQTVKSCCQFLFVN